MGELALPWPTDNNSKQEDYVKVSKALWDDKTLHDNLLEDVVEFVAPELSDMLQDNEPGREYGKRIYNTTAGQALETWTNGVYGNTVNPAMPWMRFRLSDAELNDLREVQIWLEDAQEAVYAELSKTNFYREAWPVIQHGGGVGNGTMIIEDDHLNDRILFPHVHPGQVAISEGPDGRVDTLSRKDRAPVRKFVDKLGFDVLPKELKDLYKTNPYKVVDVYHLTIPRKTFNPEGKSTKDMPIASVYIYGGKVFHETGFEYYPSVTWRHSVTESQDPYGSCPAIKVLPMIKTLNKISKDLLQMGALAARPPMNIPAEQRGFENLYPGGYMYFKERGVQTTPIDMTRDYPIGPEREDKIEDAIEKAYNVQFFLSLANKEKNRTATEVIALEGQDSIQLAPTIGRINYELLDPIVEKVFNIAMKRGRIPQPPDVILETGAQIEIDYVGPLAQAQKRLLISNPIIKTLGEVGQIMTLAPEVKDKFDFDGAAEELAKTNGFPAKFILPDEQVQAKREAQAAAIQAQQQQEQANMAADTANKLSGVSPETSEALGQTITDQAVEAGALEG